MGWSGITHMTGIGHMTAIGHMRAAHRVSASLVVLLAAAACSSATGKDEGLDDVKDQDRMTVDVATNRQMQIGYQIQSVAASDNALDLCFEMCNRSSESCHLATSVCNVAKGYPGVSALSARCDVTRERCRVHRTKVPRQCPCEQ